MRLSPHRFFRFRSACSLPSCFISLVSVFSLHAGNQQPLARPSASVNVNSRYIIELVEVTGYPAMRLPDSTRTKLGKLPGTPYDTELLDDLARSLRKDLHAKSVAQHLSRGSTPEMVKVVFEVERRSVGLDLSLPKFLYHSKQGFSAQLLASTTIERNHTFTFGLISDGDELTERYSGIQAAYENFHAGTDRLRFRFTFERYHQQWNRSTTAALSNSSLLSPALRTVTPELYGVRQNLQPTLAFALTPLVTLTAGLSFERLDESLPLARIEGANALVGGVEFRQKFIDEKGFRAAEAGYNVRVATRALGSDYLYTRHHWNAGYNLTRGRHSLSDQLTLGYISGRAPLFERFVLGTSSLLRGWNRFDIDPLGGNRLVHNSVEYHYRMANLFYDTGSLWSRGKLPSLRHSVGVGVRQSIFSLAVAFPVRKGSIDPIFMVGMNY